MSQQDLITEAFRHLNAMKRAQTLQIIERENGNMNQVNYHKVKENEHVGRLELALRAIQKEIRSSSK